MKKLPLLLVFLFGTVFLSAQEQFMLWSDTNMPNDNGQLVEDSIARERIYQIDKPYIRAWFPSQARRNGAAVLIIPGGGYARLSHIIAGSTIAKWFNTFGVSAFVLYHRLPQSAHVETSYEAPIQDAQRAIRLIRGNAEEWELDPDRIGTTGFSAGGHLAACVSNIKTDYAKGGDSLDGLSFLPNFTILVSPVISFEKYRHKGSRDNLLGKDPSQELILAFSPQRLVDASSPPAFMVHAANDRSVPVQNSIFYSIALSEAGVPFSLHIFPDGEHKIELRNNPLSTNNWSMLCETWMQEMGFLDK
ncbi:MAG: alpha/beta hydrolase [Bacteroidetes bacterium]|nr:alpha/beta hydrolase [Bacteroidota bacterium]